MTAKNWKVTVVFARYISFSYLFLHHFKTSYGSSADQNIFYLQAGSPLKPFNLYELECPTFNFSEKKGKEAMINWWKTLIDCWLLTKFSLQIQ